MEAAEKAVSEAMDQNNTEIENNEIALLSTAKTFKDL
jgi:hypothetical protein